MRILLVCLCSLLISFRIRPDIRYSGFSDSTKYGWKDYNDRKQYLQDLSHRQSLLQIYELEAQPLNANIVNQL
jgi:hypothetical protein